MLKKTRECKSCGVYKDDVIDYSETPEGIRKERCNGCKAAKEEAKLEESSKKCRRCDEQVLISGYATIENGKIDRTCKNCRIDMDKLKCSNCKEKKPSNQFRIKDVGAGLRDTKCNDCAEVKISKKKKTPK